MHGSVLRLGVRGLRRPLAWWALGLVGLVAMMMAVYPTVRDNPDLNELVQSYPEALKAFISFGGTVDYVSGAGYLGSELFSFMVPLLFLVAAIGNGAGAIAGEEERGTLDPLLATPVTRRQVVLEKATALALELVALGAVLWLALWLGALAVGMEISAANLAAATLAAVLLAAAYGVLALALGAATGRRALAVGVTAAAAVAAYLVASLANLVQALESLRPLSPYYHYAASDALRSGIDVGHMAVPLAIVVAATAAAVVAFDRRDVAA
jgi:beta-exotoxin I transport system permease protein